MNRLINEISNGVDNIQLTEPKADTSNNSKAKRARRKKRKKTATDEEPDSGGPVFNIKIEAVKKPNGTVVKKRQDSNRKINLNPYGQNNATFEFATSATFLSSISSQAEPEQSKIPAPKINSKAKKNDVKKSVVNSSTMSEEIKHGAKKSPSAKQTNGAQKKRNRKQSGGYEGTPKFEDRWDRKKVEVGLKDGTLVKGVIRINPKFYTEAYVSQEDKSLQDYFIGSVADRNGALEGDVVVLLVKPKSEWRDGQMKARVVHIWEHVHPRIAIGYLMELKDRPKPIASFQPRDKRFPFMNIRDISLPTNFYKNSSQYENILFMVQMIEWTNPKYAIGMITENLGKGNDLETENKAILLENQVDVTPFPPDLNRFLPKSKKISQKEVDTRMDLRKECVFTIDPATARDLDDALSCKLLPNGNYEVGVHIADVAHYLAENNELDILVSKKATSTYMVDNVYHMLPPELCMHCSLLPGRDNLTFSVIWEMDKNARIVSKRFTRSVINSCGQLAYEHAQKVIDNPTTEIKPNDYPFIYNGYSVRHVCRTIGQLQSLAVKLRERRVENGSLRIDQIKLSFGLDATGYPTEYYIQESKEANHLIEEFMLLANISVAERIYSDFPKLAFLRLHEPPVARMMTDLQNTLEVIGLHLDVSSSKDLHGSISKYKTHDYLGISRFAALNHLLAKPMTRARYICANQEDPATFNHYALSIPIYTHFTSPIRRYADIMVHRLLSASLGYTPKPDWDVSWVKEIAETCNRQKFNAKKAGEASCELYLAHYVEKHQPFIMDAVVIAVGEKSFDAIVIQTGSVVRIYTNAFEEKVEFTMETYGNESKKLYKMTVLFPPTKEQPRIIQIVDIFQIIQVQLKRKAKTNKLEALLVRPSHIKVLPRTD